MNLKLVEPTMEVQPSVTVEFKAPRGGEFSARVDAEGTRPLFWRQMKLSASLDVTNEGVEFEVGAGHLAI